MRELTQEERKIIQQSEEALRLGVLAITAVDFGWEAVAGEYARGAAHAGRLALDGCERA